MEDQEVTMRTPQQTGSDLMGRIEHLVAAGIPKLHLIQLSADLMVAGRVARRIGASVGQLTDWCRDCLNDHPGAAEQLIIQGMPLTMMIRLSNDLASLGWCARACSVPDSFRELAMELALAGRRAEQLAPTDGPSVRLDPSSAGQIAA
jgi:hypothetical protein